MLYQLKRHPFAVTAHFEHCLVLTYAMPNSVLTPLLPPQLELDTFQVGSEVLGMLAVAMVQTKGLRPVGFPACCGQDFFLSGYRIFTRFRGPQRTLRGLRILRSDTDRLRMKWGGNLLTHYNYCRATAKVSVEQAAIHFRIRTPNAEADLDVSANLANLPGPLPVGSCFSSVRQAARFAGPLPYTFDYEPETNSLIIIRAQRKHWHPRPITVEVRESTFFLQPPFANCRPILAGAFYMNDVSYHWNRGIRVPLEGGQP